MKRFLAILLAALLAVSAVACFKPIDDINESEIVDEYNDYTMEELYELAKAEGGKVIIYSTTADANTAIKKFKKVYPDIDIEYVSCDTNTIGEKIQIEYDTGNITSDIVMVKDASGEIYNNFVLRGVLRIFRPTTISSHIDSELSKYGLPLYATFNPWFYNTGMYPNGCPIQSWWDIVKGYNVDTKSYVNAAGENTQFWSIYTKDITGPSYASLWAQIIVDGDKMAAQYEKQYGEPLVYTYMDELANDEFMNLPENNGGVELFYRFTQMKTTELADGDAVVEAVDNSLNGPTLGLTSASKLDNRDNSGFKIAWVTGLEPYTAFQACSYTYITEGCDNPAAARLFVMFSMGGDDGQTGCYNVYDKRGAWSVRDDVTFLKSELTAEEVKLTTPNFGKIYTIYPNVKLYWTYWTSKANKK